MTDSLVCLQLRVARKERLAQDIALFELVAPDGGALPLFSAGAHIDVTTPGGYIRQYSLCNDPAESHRYQIAVLRDAQGRGGSRAMHDAVNVGDIVAASVPRNHFPLIPQVHTALLLAGGIGITPLISMAERLSAIRQPFSLHYVARSIDRMAFRDRLAQSSYADKVFLHVDDGPPEQRLDIAGLLQAVHTDVHIYVCGPQGFMDAVLSTAQRYGWPQAQLHHEFFGAAPTRTDADSSFDVQLASSGRVIRVAADQTVTQALATAGVVVPTSCEQGVCGTCLTGVLNGEPDHRDLYLTAEEQAANRQFIPCCSRARSARLVLDL
ncbi:PDR/VanB family oxidoreductase [Rhodoferax sp.]|uniref:PDR/VanB family oxidoreductase n=1 Tax=Rhodoferax sp. TaxID=50421 RepID=UPI00272671C0|nr:PDR/VanB family oxidoreductase [Rhodoferax sp.]MDO9195398.1 PDR/VanB family oxidoreductase [Rhodoferax sp.]